MLRPGDVLLFEDKKFDLQHIGPIGIRLITGNRVTHVGIVIDTNPGNEDWIAWADTNPKVTMRIQTSSIEALKKDYHSALKLTGIAHLPDDWYRKYPIEPFFNAVAEQIRGTNASRHYSYRVIMGFMIDHLWRRFRSDNEPYRSWLGSNGYVCSSLVAKVIDEVVGKYLSNWHRGKSNFNVWEPDDFTTDLFQVELWNSKTS